MLPQHSIGDLSQTFSSVISDDESNVTQIPSPQHNQSDNTKTRNIRIPEAVMNKFLDSIGKDYYSDLDEFSPGLQHTSDGYVYYPDLMEPEQGKRLHTFIIRMNTKPGLLKKVDKQHQNGHISFIKYFYLSGYGFLHLLLLIL